MKKLLSFLLILFIACSFVACDTSAKSNSEQHKLNNSTETQPKPNNPESKEKSLSINTEYFDLFDKNKGEVDALFGEGDFWTELALMVYDNGIQISYNTYNLDGDLDDSDMVYSVYLPLKYLFNDCPSTITADDIKNTFENVREDYAIEDETNILIATYMGKDIFFYPEWGMSPEVCAYISQ